MFFKRNNFKVVDLRPNYNGEYQVLFSWKFNSGPS